MPMNPMWVRFRSASGANNIPDPRLTDIDVKVTSLDRLEPALQQARNVLLMTHRGIEDFSFRTQENQIQSINSQIRNARLSGGIGQQPSHSGQPQINSHFILNQRLDNPPAP